jgi:hypothetical protein
VVTTAEGRPVDVGEPLRVSGARATLDWLREYRAEVPEMAASG